MRVVGGSGSGPSKVQSSCSPSSAFQVVLLKVRVVVVVLIHRLKDLKMREAALLMCLKMRVAALLNASKDEKGSSSKGESSRPLKGESSSPR